MKNAKNKARHILTETISELQSTAHSNNLDIDYNINRLKGLYKYLRDMNPGTVITANIDESQILYHPPSVNIFNINTDAEHITDKTIFWSSTVEVRGCPGYYTKIGVMKDEEDEAGWKTVIGWGKFNDYDDQVISLPELKGSHVCVQALPLASYDLGMRLVTRRLSEIAEGRDPDPDPTEVILSPGA